MIYTKPELLAPSSVPVAPLPPVLPSSYPPFCLTPHPPSGCSHSCIHPASCLAVQLLLDSDSITPARLTDAVTPDKPIFRQSAGVTWPDFVPSFQYCFSLVEKGWAEVSRNLGLGYGLSFVPAGFLVNACVRCSVIFPSSGEVSE